MKNNVETELRKAFNDGFRKVQRDGLLQGAVAIAKVILDKARDVSKSPNERLADIVKFCKVSLGDKTKYED